VNADGSEPETEERSPAITRPEDTAAAGPEGTSANAAGPETEERNPAITRPENTAAAGSESGREVVICGFFAETAVAILTAAGLTPRLFPDFTPEAESAARTAEALVVRSHTPVTAAVMDRCPRLRVIGRPGSGTEQVDSRAAAERDIAIVSAPGANAPTVAEHTFALLLALIRRLDPLLSGMRAGRWEKAGYAGAELAGRTLLLVGLGQVGTEVARRARAFEMRLIACDPGLDSAAFARELVEPVGWPDGLAAADIVSLHLPAGPETTRLLNARTLAMLPPGALVINTARGALIDEEALLAALENGHLGGAALDVFASEPPGSTSLLQHPRVIATPHVGGAGPVARERAARVVADRIVAILTGGS